jgi:predicted amidohydrolase YtcJ
MTTATYRIAVAILLFIAAFAATAAPTLLENVDGYTLAGGELRHFSGIVFEHGRVVETGNAAGLHRAYPAAKTIDGRGRGLLPGLIDAHGHIVGLGIQSERTDLTGTRSLAEAQQRIRAYRSSHPHQAWLLGGGWNQVLWGLGRFPLATELDAVEKDRPAVMERVDGHAKWLNSAALRAAGITKETPDPVGGRIERDAAGNPNGVLVDKAMEVLDRVAPPPTEAERRNAVLAALKHMNSVGLTSAVDAGSTASDVALYRKLADDGRLSVRIYAMIADVGPDFASLAKNGPLIGYHDERLSVRAVKLFADGALGSRGAALTAPYADSPGQRGLLFLSAGEMEKKIETALRAGYQVGVHAIGDAANHQVLDAFEAAYRVAGGRELRNRIEHAQIVAPADIPRFKQLDLIASMQPSHATSDMNMAEDRLGRDRLRGAYAWRTLLSHGTRIAGGSDFPVESDNPFFGLYAAVTRTDHAGQPAGGWRAEEAMTLVEAFRAFTLDAAYAEHLEQSIGSLEPGKWADFILTDRSLFAVRPSEIWRIRVEQTWMAGRRVY